MNSPHPSVRRARTAWIAACVAAASLAAMFGETAYAQSGAPIAGIARYEIEVLGSGLEGLAACNTASRAYEVTDCGLVVGQIARFADASQTDCLPWSTYVYDAFVYAKRARPEFGLAEGQFLILPNDLGSSACVALDANDQGYIVGSTGAGKPFSPEYSLSYGERACYWKLSRGPDGQAVAEQVIVDPPAHSSYVPYEQGGFGRLTSIARGETPWSSGTFRIIGGCGFGPSQQPRFDAAAVRISNPITQADYRIGAVAANPSGNPQSAGVFALGIAPGGALMSGYQRNNCAAVFCESADPLSRAWAVPAQVVPLVVGDRTPDPVVSAGYESTAPIRSILDDGTACGYVNDTWNPDSTSGGCRRFACAWRAGGLSDDVIAILPGPIGKGSEAFDIERLADCSSGALLVGRANGPLDGESYSGYRGFIWFRPDTAGQNWQNGWDFRSVSTMVPPNGALPDEPKGTTFKVTWLHGVNDRGDAVGQIELSAPGLPTRLQPVLLRAVPTPRVGDANGDGLVNGADLAVVLSAWGGGGGSAADFNGDGIVNGADLSIILGNWNLCPLQTCTP